MAAELRGGLSFGLSGFSFWSHDVGGFVSRAMERATALIIRAEDSLSDR
jgi:alpha-glucosidase (family GH31 glycosyl hydrolase)